MKRLILIRHAKSDWSNLQQKDFDRELNSRGLRDAPMMGNRLAKRELGIDLLLSSTAKRTEQTSKMIAKELAFPFEKIMWTDKLYHAPAAIIEDVILEIEDDFNCIVVVCHNNGITDFINQLAGNIIDNLPTCGMVGFDIESDTWRNLSMAKKKLLFYDYPKNL
ncbi:MAG: histidine phosphatase family protein [Bacteroidetes bacterium]|nr:histidine phosphatase family protein [Bacteroidota bacterium]